MRVKRRLGRGAAVLVWGAAAWVQERACLAGTFGWGGVGLLGWRMDLGGMHLLGWRACLGEARLLRWRAGLGEASLLNKN